MQAFHSFWSKPNYFRTYDGEIFIPDFELFTMLLSALKWREQNGPIAMITDSRGAAYFKKLGFENIWDRMDTFLDEVDDDIDPILFWAAGKLYALKKMEMPAVMLDTDLIIWKNMKNLSRYDILATHAENLAPEVYPDPKIFQLKNGYAFPEEWDFTQYAANTAFLYIKDAAFRDAYVKEAVGFFRNVELDGLNTVTAMCFGEQRILPMCAKQAGKEIHYLFDLYDANEQDFVTHTWGFKDVLRNSPEVNENFCMRCANRVLDDFPEQERLLANCAPLRKYYLKIKER